MARIKIDDLKQDQEISKELLKRISGGYFSQTSPQILRSYMGTSSYKPLLDASPRMAWCGY